MEAPVSKRLIIYPSTLIGKSDVIGLSGITTV